MRKQLGKFRLSDYKIGKQQLKEKGCGVLVFFFFLINVMKKLRDMWASSNLLVTLFQGVIDSIWFIPIPLLFSLYFWGHLILLKLG